MRVIVQRVKRAEVLIADEVYNQIGVGYLIYVGFTQGDSHFCVDKMTDKITNLRIFEDADGKINKNLKDVSGAILAISQFTLYGDTKGNNRPSFTKALEKNEAIVLYDYFLTKLGEKQITKGGVFGADMRIFSINDGPMTIIIEM